MIGANFPDIDAIAVPLGYGLEWRRGWTHGVLAHLVLPFVLTALMLAWDRLVRRRGAPASLAPADPRALLILAALSIWTHPLLDFMNVYGMRWLMPFSGRWFYADALFIIDPWMWAMLAAGVVFARAGRGERRARLALALTATYVLAMLGSAVAARSHMRQRLAALGVDPSASLMAAPVAVTPLRRHVVADAGDRYLTGSLRFTPFLRFEPGGDIPKQAAHPAAVRAAATAQGQAFLGWSRFPFYEVRAGPSGTFVRIADARYARRAAASWAERTVFLPGEPAPVP